MSIVRRWARRWSRRQCQPLLLRCIPASTQNLHDDLKQNLIVGPGGCTKQGTGLFSEASPLACNARSLCSSTMCLRQVEPAVDCLNIADSEVDSGRASMKEGTIEHLSPHSAGIGVFDMSGHQSGQLASCNLHRTSVQKEMLPFQDSADMGMGTGFFLASSAMESMGSVAVTDVLDEHCKVSSTSSTCDHKEDYSPMKMREDTSYGEQHIVAGSKSDEDGEDDAQELFNLGKLNGSSRPELSSEDEKVIQDICTFLDSKAWDVDTEQYLSKKYAPCLSHLVVAMVINRQRRLPVAKRFLEWASSEIGHDTYSYHALLLKLGRSPQIDEMWRVVDRMKCTGCPISETTFCILIKAFGATLMPEMAMDTFQKMSEYGVVASSHAYTTLISVLFKLKLLGEAHLCFNKMIVDGVKLDMNLFSTLICGFGVIGSLRDAQACYDMMLSHALEPDLSTFNSLIEAFCCCNAMQSAMATLAAMQKRGLKPRASTINVILKKLCKDGKLEAALDFFVDMKGRQSVQLSQATYNILFQGLLAAKEFSRAMGLFKQMENEGFIDSRSYVLLSDGLRQTEQTLELLGLLNGLFDVHGFSNVEVCNALIYNLSHLDALDDAEKIFRGMVMAQKQPSIPSYAIMISCYCRVQKLEEAIELLAELRGRDRIPSVFCYTPIITLLLRRDRALDALIYFQEMQFLGLEINCITCDYLLKVLCRQGMIEKAIEICHLMMARRFTVSTETLFELMKCLGKLQSAEAATLCFRKLYKKNALPQCKAVSQALAVMNLYCAEE